MATRSLLLLALALLVSACSTTAEAQVAPVSTRGDTNPRALAAAEQGALGKPAVIFFHADWCTVCRTASPALDELAEEYDNRIALVRMDIDDAASRPAVDRYRVQATPTFVLLSAGGNVLAAISGWPGKDGMEMTLQQMLETDN